MPAPGGLDQIKDDWAFIYVIYRNPHLRGKGHRTGGWLSREFTGKVEKVDEDVEPGSITVTLDGPNASTYRISGSDMDTQRPYAGS